MTNSIPPSTSLPRPWINITRIAWILMSATGILLVSMGLANSWGEPLPVCTLPDTVCAPWTVSQEDFTLAQQAGMPLQWMYFAYFAGFLIPKVAFCLVGLLIFWRRSRDWVAQMLSLMLVLFALEGVLNLGTLQPVADVLYAISTVIFGLLPFIFPNGRFAPGWIGWVAIPNAILSTFAVFMPQLGFSLTDDVYAAVILIVYLFWFLLAFYSVFYRYKYISNATERQQTKWALAGIMGSFILIIPMTIIAIYFPPSQPSIGRLSFVFLVHYPVYIVSYLFIPGGIAIAILRYRLWDIDILIRRTLQYSVLTGLLALVYFGTIVILQWILRPLTGQTSSPLVTVFTTLGIAVLFNPLRHRVQEFIDRRFYQKKYDAQLIVEAFAAAAQHETNLDALVDRLVLATQNTLEPESVSLWIRKKKDI